MSAKTSKIKISEKAILKLFLYCKKENRPNQGHFDFFFAFDLEAAFFFAAIQVNFFCVIKHVHFGILQNNFVKFTKQKTNFAI
ncbi:MAG: hypothetical protein ACT4OD_01370 [Candidatus Nitrosotenuis sp.]